MRQLIIFLILAIFTAGSVMAKPPGTKLYKWVDENGKIQYSDAPPAMPQKKGVAEMSRQGIITRQAESAEEKQARLAAEAEQKQEEARLRETARRDRALLDTYSSVKQIEQARDRKIGGATDAIKIMAPRQKSAQTRLTSLQAEANKYTARKQPVPAALTNNINAAKSDLQETNKIIQSRQQEIRQIRAQADNDIKRYRELTAPRPVSSGN